MKRILVILALLLTAAPAEAGYKEGELAYRREQWAAAIAELRPLAQKNDPDAAFLLAKMYLEGNGVIPNAVEAMRLYRIAAAKGHVDATVSIGAIYQSGIGYQKNIKLANRWFARAARLGSQYAALLYGASLFQGDTTGQTDLKPDAKTAYKWFRIAATTGSYEKVRDAATAAAAAASNRLSAAEKAEIDKAVATFQPETVGEVGELPELVE
jgi:uncharacterized protein